MTSGKELTSVNSHVMLNNHNRAALRTINAFATNPRKWAMTKTSIRDHNTCNEQSSAYTYVVKE